MSDLPRCPYCGAVIWDTPIKQTEEGAKLICDSCARSYVYIPGYGSFALSDIEDEKIEIPILNTILDDEEERESNAGNIAKVCFTLCCLLSGVPFVLFMIVMVLMSLF